MISFSINEDLVIFFYLFLTLDLCSVWNQFSSSTVATSIGKKDIYTYIKNIVKKYQILKKVLFNDTLS
jgi:hypothetical protein